MKSIFISFALIFIATVSAYTIVDIESVTGRPEIIEFDSNGNSYVVAQYLGSRQLYKLNPEKEVVLKVRLLSQVQKILINSHDEVYVISDPTFGGTFVGILDEETSSIKKIEVTTRQFVFFFDEEDNLIYNKYDAYDNITNTGGVYLLRRNSKTPLPITNLEKWVISGTESYAVDSQGNIYVGITVYGWEKSGIAVISKEAKQGETPSANIIIEESTHYTNHLLNHLLIDQNDDVWVTRTGMEYFGYIDKIVNNNLIRIFTDEKYSNHRALAMKDRICIVGYMDEGATSSAFFITLDGEIVPIPELSNFIVYQSDSAEPFSDKHGNLYVTAPSYPFDAPINSSLAYVKYGETKATGIGFKGNDGITSWDLDGDDDVWLLIWHYDVYLLKNGEMDAVKVESPEEYFLSLKVNKKTRDVFLLRPEGLSYISKDYAQV